MRPRRIVSGGQTGADRGALDAAIELGIDHGGYCPRGRRAEDGAIPDRYQLTELASADYPARTRANVEAADATCVITRGAPTGGTRLTVELARRNATPLLVLDLDRDAEPAQQLRSWLRQHEPVTVNVAGPRESGCPGIAEDVRALLLRALS